MGSALIVPMAYDRSDFVGRIFDGEPGAQLGTNSQIGAAQ